MIPKLFLFASTPFRRAFCGEQITAEQILREAKELQEQDFKPPKQKISDQTELDEYRLRKRKEFEDLVRRVRWNSSIWVKVLHKPTGCAAGLQQRMKGSASKGGTLWEDACCEAARRQQACCVMQYAQWEESQKDFRRARSVWERALEVSYTNATTWLKYAEMEMRHRFINHARNVWDRAVSLLPRVDQLW